MMSVDFQELLERGFSVAPSKEQAILDNAAKLMGQATVDGLAPFRPRGIALNTWEDWSVLTRQGFWFEIEIKNFPSLTYKFLVERLELFELMEDECMGLYLAAKVYGHYKYLRRMVEPSPLHILGEN